MLEIKIEKSLISSLSTTRDLFHTIEDTIIHDKHTIIIFDSLLPQVSTLHVLIVNNKMFSPTCHTIIK